MIQSITIDIINEKALLLLKDLELLQLIRLRKETKTSSDNVNWSKKHKGAMTKQSPAEIDNQFNELRNDWE